MGSAIGRILGPRDVVLLTGALGSGKTRLAKGIVSAAAKVPQEEVVSPTFTLVNTFEGDFPVNHADLYRVEPSHVAGIGLEDLLDEGGALVVEWAEKIPGLLEDPLEIDMSYTEDDNSRKIVLRWSAEGPWNRRLEKIAGTQKK